MIPTFEDRDALPACQGSGAGKLSEGQLQQENGDSHDHQHDDVRYEEDGCNQNAAHTFKKCILISDTEVRHNNYYHTISEPACLVSKDIKLITIIIIAVPH